MRLKHITPFEKISTVFVSDGISSGRETDIRPLKISVGLEARTVLILYKVFEGTETNALR